MHRVASTLAILAWLAELTYLAYLYAQGAGEPFVIEGVQITLAAEPSVLLWKAAVIVGSCLAVIAFFARRRWELLVFASAAIYFAGWFAFGYWGGGPVNAYALRWRVAQHFGGLVAVGFYLRDILIPVALAAATTVAVSKLLRGRV